METNIHIYIYIYIVTHRQTVSFYQNSSVWLDTQDVRSRDRNPSDFTFDCVSDHSSTKRTTLAMGILRYFYFYKQQQQQPLFTFFYTLLATRVLNSFEELCIKLVAASNSFASSIWYVLFVCVCWSGFRFHSVIFFICVWMCVLRFFCIYIYIYIYAKKLSIHTFTHK